ncbi:MULTISPECIES: formate dehydrogenase accessory sulfurtransferase FdhD [unclassified Adlercreutzia]|uniref:formate dehydrogenase accessory sulfurtransferase FdhD n=1 Tax=unclassified Adlercreutzia TaxID=2636013 RepID=UPI0013EA1658|nr:MULTISPECIES: formate dehydrogenase accessory sulfurtransferase FdhD [unclassified Adlercreutzia]
MDVIDRHAEGEVVAPYVACCVSADGVEASEDVAVLVEHNMDVYVNEILTMRIVCTPNHLVDLVVGRLFSEGIIAGIDDVASVYLCEHGTRARVILSGHAADFSKTGVDVVPSCCTGNRSFNHYFDADEAPAKVTPITWERAWVFAAAHAFAQDSPLHRRTFGTHSCYLLTGGDIVCCREDLGRHNAFDKALGAALRGGVDLRQAMVFSSGRIPVDMVMKAIRAGVPVLATKAVPTDATIELARAYDLTLICSARPDSMRVCHDPLGERRRGVADAGQLAAADVAGTGRPAGAGVEKAAGSQALEHEGA